MRARSFPTKREAETWQASVEHEIRAGTYRDRTVGQVSFGVVAEEWLATRTDITLSSRRTYRAALDRHVLPQWGPVIIAAIRRRDIATWLTSLGERLGPRSVTGVHRVTSMVLGWTVETDRIPANPPPGSSCRAQCRSTDGR
jgi:hypothetical protein